VITKEFLFLHELYQDNYEKMKAQIKTHNGFAFPIIGSITLPLKFGPKKLSVSFSIILMSNQFHVKLGYPWLHSINVISLVVHKCLKFPFGNEILTMHHNDFDLLSSCGNVSLDFFWPEPIQPIRPCEDFFFNSYQFFLAY
jgi:hypothetical protein